MKRKKLILTVASTISFLFLCQISLATPLFYVRKDYTVGYAYSVATGDLDGNGSLDLAVANRHSKISVLLNNGDGTFQSAVYYELGNGPVAIAIGDLDGNGSHDLAVAKNYSDNVSVLLNNGDGSFQSAINYDAGGQTSSVVIGDFDRNGSLDLALTKLYSDNVSLLFNNGNGTFQSPVNYGVGDEPQAIAIGDLDANGSPDLAVANYESYNVSVLLNNGDGTFQIAVDYIVGHSPQSLVLGDFDDNGSKDLAVATRYTDSVSVLLGNGDGTFQSAVNYDAGDRTISVTAGDLDGNNTLDLAVAINSDTISVLLGNGDGTFQSPVSYDAGDYSQSIAIGDLDGNNSLDLSVTKYYSDEISVFINSSVGIWYVDWEIPVSGEGPSWSEAFKTIQESIDSAADGDEIWVKAGTYDVSSVSERIVIENEVRLYGGFNGTEGTRTERDWLINETIVDGHNTSLCFEIQQVDALIDGFTITRGKTNWGGGGMYVNRASPIITNCRFIDNIAGTNGGGGIHNNSASPIITNCVFSGNYGGTNGGGAVFNWNCPQITISNSTFADNDGGINGGGAIYNRNSSCTVTNSILWNNLADIGSEVLNEDSTFTISHCDIEGGILGIVNVGYSSISDDGSNITIDPLFATTYHLQAGSECINSGTNIAPNLPSIDMDDEQRIQGPFCDIGADEFHDIDGDGMPDWWEAIYGPDDPYGDNDGDGLSKLQEYEIGTNPDQIDSDRDGLSDYDEVYLYFTKPADFDSDNDGVGDGAEIGIGTDPNNPSQTPECPLSYYVSPTGSDSNNCLFPGLSCKTIQHAIDVAHGTETCPLTIYVAGGQYVEHLVMDSWESLEGGWNHDFSQRWNFEADDLKPSTDFATILEGSGRPTMALTSDYIAGDLVLTVDAVRAVFPGDTIEIKFFKGDADWSWDGESAEVVDTTDTTITIANSLNNSYYVADDTYIYNASSSSDSPGTCLLIDKAKNVVVEGIIIQHGEGDIDKEQYSYGGLGGGAYCYYASVDFKYTTFLGNSAVSGTGLHNLYSSVSISNSLIKRNYHDFGGEGYPGWVIYNLGGTLSIRNSDFIENSAYYANFGIFNRSNWSEFIGCKFKENKGWETGPTIYNKDNSPFILNCVFENNFSIDGRNGGVIRNENSNPFIINCLFARNLTSWAVSGSAITNYSASPKIINCTFVDNSDDIGGEQWDGTILNIDSSSPTITNSIFWQYDPDLLELNAPFIVNDASSTALVSFSNIDQDGYEGLNGNIRQDPMFYDTGWDDNGTPDEPWDDIWIGGDYHLKPGSPCTNAGDSAALPPDTADLDNDGDTVEPTPLDIAGNPRLYGGIVDIGAYEYRPFCPGDFEPDGDVDGTDMRTLIAGNSGTSLQVFAENFGRNNCQ